MSACRLTGSHTSRVTHIQVNTYLIHGDARTEASLVRVDTPMSFYADEDAQEDSIETPKAPEFSPFRANRYGLSELHKFIFGDISSFSPHRRGIYRTCVFGAFGYKASTYFGYTPSGWRESRSFYAEEEDLDGA